MPIRRPRGPRPTLRYIAFLEAMTTAPTRPALQRDLAAFATLRLLDHWLALGAEVADPAQAAHRVTRRAVHALPREDPLRGLLGQILRAITMLLEPDPHALGSRVLALGEHYESNGRFAQAADVYAAATRMIDPSVKADWAFRAHLRRGFCLLVVGEHHWAEREFERAGQLAAMHRDRWGQIVSRMGIAKLELARGATRAADRLLREAAQDCERLVREEPRPAKRRRSGRARHR